MQMQAALGVTGVEGGFRQGCEHVLRVARQHSTTLSSLLQAILTDPLVTWVSDKQQAGSKKVRHLLAQHCLPLLQNALVALQIPWWHASWHYGVYIYVCVCPFVYIYVYACTHWAFNAAATLHLIFA